jgi:hypothetical protein
MQYVNTKNTILQDSGKSGENWLPDMDSNHDKQIQKLLCYHYTIRQMRHQINHFAISVKQA